MIRGCIDESIALLSSTSTDQVFFREGNDLFFRNHHMTVSCNDILGGIVRSDEVCAIDEQSLDTWYLPNDTTTLRQFAIIRNNDDRLLFSPDTTLQDPPEEYLSKGRFHKGKNLVNDWHFLMLHYDCTNNTGLTTATIQEYSKELYDNRLPSWWYTRGRAIINSKRRGSTIAGGGFRFSPWSIRRGLELRLANWYFDTGLLYDTKVPHIVVQHKMYCYYQLKQYDEAETFLRFAFNRGDPRRRSVIYDEMANIGACTSDFEYMVCNLECAQELRPTTERERLIRIHKKILKG